MCRYVEDLLPLTKIMAGPEMSRELRLDDEVDMRRLRVFYMEVRDDIRWWKTLECMI